MVVGLFAEVLAFFAFYGIAQAAHLSSDAPLVFAFIATMAVIGVTATLAARFDAPGGLRRDVATLISATLFSSLIVYVILAAKSLQESG